METTDGKADLAASCKDFADLLALHGVHQLFDEGKRDLLSAHLAVCANCRVSLTMRRHDAYEAKRRRTRIAKEETVANEASREKEFDPCSVDKEVYMALPDYPNDIKDPAFAQRIKNHLRNCSYCTLEFNIMQAFKQIGKRIVIEQRSWN